MPLKTTFNNLRLAFLLRLSYASTDEVNACINVCQLSDELRKESERILEQLEKRNYAEEVNEPNYKPSP